MQPLFKLVLLGLVLGPMDNVCMLGLPDNAPLSETGPAEKSESDSTDTISYATDSIWDSDSWFYDATDSTWFWYDITTDSNWDWDSWYNNTTDSTWDYDATDSTWFWYDITTDSNWDWDSWYNNTTDSTWDYESDSVYNATGPEVMNKVP